MKKILAIIMTFAVLFGVFSVAFAAEDGLINSVESEQEVPEGYTAIRTAEDLNNIRNDLAGKYILMNDIDLSVYENWGPIGDAKNPFTGELDGNGFMIKNMTISVTQQEILHAGLLGVIENATIKNLTIDNGNVDISAKNGIYAGLICGEAYCSAISKCVVHGNINAETESNVCIGGISGNLLSYTISGTDSITSVIEKCQNKANIIINAICNKDAGGINYFSGGIVGFNKGIVSKCSNHGNINAVGKSEKFNYFYTLAGGICGNSSDEITNCYNAGNISSIGTKYVFAGGITGHWYQFGNISNCHNVGEIKAEVKDTKEEYTFAGAGGIIGETEPVFELLSAEGTDNNSVVVKNCYYLNSIDKAYGNVNPETSINVKLLSVDEFAIQSSFVGFDFDNVWVMSAKHGYPIHKNELTFPEEESTTENTTIPEETAPTTVPETTEPVTETTTISEPSATEKEETTQPTTAPVTEPETQPSTVPESTTETNNSNKTCWIIRILIKIFNLFKWIFSYLSC